MHHFTFFFADECAVGTHRCDSLATCVNTPGDYSCHCPTGYRANGTRCIGGWGTNRVDNDSNNINDEHNNNMTLIMIMIMIVII